MKIKTEQEIENLADAKHRQLNITRKVWTFKDGFTQGYTQAQQDILASSSEGFEEWYKKEIGSHIDYELSHDNMLSLAWQAAKLSSAKELELIKKKITPLMPIIEKQMEALEDIAPIYYDSSDPTGFTPYETIAWQAIQETKQMLGKLGEAE